MNRKRIALLTGLTMFSGITISNHNLLRNTTIQRVNAAEIKNKLKSKQKYPDVTKKLDITSMAQYSSNTLFMNVTLNNFYIKDLASDEKGHLHILLSPIKTSNQYFLVTVPSNNKIKRDSYITIQGFLNGKTRIDDELGLNKKYLNKKVVSMLVDNISLNEDTKKP